jgi:signal transduction histidine kinase
VKKHSAGTHAEVRLEAITNALYLSIADGGVGFDMTERSNRTGLGIRSMQERLRLLGGKVEIRSWPGKGTKVEVWVPLNPVIAGTETIMRQLDFYCALTRPGNEPVPIFPGSSW